jgi:amino acid adenylation domain-containing protein
MAYIAQPTMVWSHLRIETGNALTLDYNWTDRATPAQVLWPESFTHCRPFADRRLIQDRFLTQARRSPQASAIIHEDRVWTYTELEHHSRTLACHLQRMGFGTGSRLVILADRCPELIWTMLAVLRAGGVFVILDSAYPLGRLETLLDLCQPGAVLTAGDARLGAIADQLATTHHLPVIDSRSPCVDTGHGIGDLDQASPDDAAYFLFTSGSTGSPKCVACSHLPLTHFIAWHIGTFGLAHTDRFTLLSGLSHDPLLRDIFAPLSMGASIVIPRQSTITQPGGLRAWMHEHDVTVAHITPAMGQLLAAGGPRAPALPHLRHVFWGGDQLRTGLVKAISALAPAVAQTNFYGCTETPQAATSFRQAGTATGNIVPIGKGMHGVQAFLVDEDKAPVGPDASGEIAIRSGYLTLGYVTRGVVVAANDRGVGPDGNKNIYYTGDRGKYLSNGDILMLGRSDDQVKIRGFRVELSEITNNLAVCPNVKSSIALCIGEEATASVHAFICTDIPSRFNEQAIQDFLASRLPHYMMPSRVWNVGAELPLLPNGKTDRQKLRDLALARLDAATVPSVRQPQSTTSSSDPETNLLREWTEIFGANELSLDSSFMSLGGDSLSYVKAYLATEQVVGIVPSGWTEKTISELTAKPVERSRFWAVVDSAMLIRALSIALIVAYHFGLSQFGDGLTAGLFIVSGYLFGGIQYREVLRKRSSQLIMRSVSHLLTPTLCFVVILLVFELLRHRFPPLSVVLLTADFMDQSPTAWALRDSLLWYIDALIHILLALYCVLGLVFRIYGNELKPFGLALTLFGVACLLRFGLPALFDSTLFVHGAPAMSFFTVAPTTHIASFLLGVILANAASRHRRLWVGAITLCYAVASIPLFSLYDAGIITCASLILLAMPRVLLPRPLATLAFMLSGASLFIYLTHIYFAFLVRAICGFEWPAVQLVAALAGGVVLQAAWNSVSGFIARRRGAGRSHAGSSAVGVS